MLIKGLLIHPRPLRVIVLQMATVPEYLQPLLHTNSIVYDIGAVHILRNAIFHLFGPPLPPLSRIVTKKQTPPLLIT
jgi:hypothetical protein